MSLHHLLRSRGQCKNQYLHGGFPLVVAPKSEKLKQNSGALPLVQEEHGLVLSVSGVYIITRIGKERKTYPLLECAALQCY